MIPFGKKCRGFVKESREPIVLAETYMCTSTSCAGVARGYLHKSEKSCKKYAREQM